MIIYGTSPHSRSKGILERMRYVYRCRRLVKIVYDETNNPIFSDGKDNRPSVNYALATFRRSEAKYNNEIANETLAIATGDQYLGVEDSRDFSDKQQRLVVKSEGVKLLISNTYFVNELAGSLGKISPVGAWAASIASLIVAVMVATHIL